MFRVPSMTENQQNLREAHVLGHNTTERRVKVEACPALGRHQIKHVGTVDAAAPYHMVRADLSGAYMLACFGGRGQILLDGRWQTIGAGTACLAPPHVVLAFRALPKTRWQFCWVRYQQRPEQKPIISSSSPAVARFDAEPMRAAITGLWHEVQSPVAPATNEHWVDIIHTYVLRFAQPWHVDDRLRHLWDAVSTNLSEHWNLEKLSRQCHFSAEHLRRLCHQEIGRSPMHQVTYLRMERAAKLLTTTGDKIEVIAAAVGYDNPFVFSRTFKKWIGWPPSDYRTRQKS
jgi:AraC-like DNA-binding protein